jgi:CRP/FNR family transcriptional regulator, cyclic AMP receptor protein
MRDELLASCPQVVVRADEPLEIPAETALLVVEAGLITSVVSRSGRRFVVSFAGVGDLMLPPAKGMALEALRPSRVRVVSEGARRRLLADPASAEEIFAGLATSVREHEQSLSHFAARVHEERVLAKLLQLGRKFGRVTPHGIRLDLPLTHQLLADAVGAARETVSVILRKLQRDGTIKRVGRTYVLKLPPHELEGFGPDVLRRRRRQSIREAAHIVSWRCAGPGTR